MPRTTEGTLPTDYAFTGQRQDSDGLLYYGARYYEASLNRWIQPDSIIPDWYNPQSLNRYAYVLNSPLNYTDPTGHCAELEGEDDGLCVRFTRDESENEEIVVVHGGSEFVNSTEVGLANYMLTGNTNWLNQVTEANPNFISNSIHRVATSLGYPAAGTQVPPDILAMLGAAAIVSRGDKTDNLSSAPPTWGNPKTLKNHAVRHGPDFGINSEADYAKKASDFLLKSQTRGLPTKVDPEGIIRVWDPKTNTFGSYNPDGSTKTFFKPDAPFYFWYQPGKAPYLAGGK